MKDSIIKARKDHNCDACDGIILKGQSYRLQKGRTGSYDIMTDEQIGIDFYEIKTHLDSEKCYWPEECRKGNHKMDTWEDGDPYSDTCGQTFHFCTECSTHKDEIEQHNLQTLIEPK